MNEHRQKHALALAAIMVLHVLFPPLAAALTGGATQPEFSSFEPVGTTEMVNLPDGDFTYNIPLLDVGGYPLNLAYHSGITQDMEASAVGLGWTINPGVINRNVRALPDDFMGENDAIRKEFNMRPNVTVGLGVGAETELFGKKIDWGSRDTLSLSLSLNLGVFINNYHGVGYEFGLAPSFLAGEKSEEGLTKPLGPSAGLGVNSKDGTNFSADLTFSGVISKTDKHTYSGKGKIGLAVNSKEGLEKLSLAGSIKDKKKNKIKKTDKGTVERKATGAGAGYKFSFAGKTFVPGMAMSHNNLSFSLSFKPDGLALFGSNLSLSSFSGYVSTQQLRSTSLTKNPYGLLYAEQGKNDVHGLMDFNREKDAAFKDYSIHLPLVNPGYDVLNVSGQGIGGSYQLKRSDVPIFFDSKSTSVANGGSLGLEAGKPGMFHGGVDVKYNNTNSFSEKWTEDNHFLSGYHFGASSSGAYEAAYYRAAGEMAVETDLDFYNDLGQDQAVRAYLEQPDRLKPFRVVSQPRLVRDYDAPAASPSGVLSRKARARRNQPISYLTAEEAAAAGLQRSILSHELNDFSGSGPVALSRVDARTGRQKHHISQVETVREDGLRYVFGIPAYNLSKEEVSFNVAGRSVDCKTGNVIYAPDRDDSVDNERGSDYYYSKVTTPAYAHAYLLTAVLGQDYEDVGGDGPSVDDLGSYTLINYSNTTLDRTTGRVQPYQWRVPFQENGAHYNAGFFSKEGDDKASYIYGRKEIWLVHSIESKTMVAEFFYEDDRQDGFGVADRHGGFAAGNPNKVLKKITLYAKPDRVANGDDATPIKTVHFRYNYELCPGTLNSRAGGKLTLQEVYFTYGHSHKGRLSSYEFSYKSPTDFYDGKAYDRWGNYQPNTPNNRCQNPKPGDPIPNDEYPYSEQDPALVRQTAGTWCLNHIKLPSGGEINVAYGPRHYGYVQDQPAMQMVKITGTSAPDGKSLYRPVGSGQAMNYLRLKLDLRGAAMEDYLRDIAIGKDYVYLRCYLNLNGQTGADAKYEYVSLYARIAQWGADWIELEGLPTGDRGPLIHPVSKFGFQFVREHLPKIAYGQTTVTAEDVAENPLAFLAPMVAMGRQLRSFVTGFNSTLIDRGYCAQIDVQGRSYLRLMTPGRMKYGGGALVKRITITDNWSDMTNGVHQSFTYGQEYDYTTVDPTTGERISSGVAAYEPLLGGDENPLRQPVEVNEERRWAIDNIHFVEEPLGEDLMPAPRIVYSEIKVQNLPRANVRRTATGHSVMKYFTAKDFPVKVDRTGLSKKPRRMSPILNLLKLKVRDHLTASQGFVVETNNMHGQARAREVYDANGTLISKVEYHYKTKPDGSLDNTVEAMGADGRLQPALLGVDYDLAGDAREAKTKTISAGAEINVDGFTVALLPIVVPMVWPSFEGQEKRFRSISLTKQVKKFGVLERVVAYDSGSTIATENKVWDAETGQVLLTRTYNEFEDPVYNLNLPAHLYYAGMQGAYQNIGATAKLTNQGSGLYRVPDASLFIPGDEVLVSITAPQAKAWVLHADATTDQLLLIGEDGSPSNTFPTGAQLKVVRSGHRNMPGASIGSLTSRQDPFASGRLRLDRGTEVLHAAAVEYSDEWQTFCSDATAEGRYCFPDGQVNPYSRGILGNWKAKRSWLFLTEREQQPLAASNTNIRTDGTYEDFQSFWQYSTGRRAWEKQPAGWEWTTEVTRFNPNGTELENRDRLGRYAAEILGYYHQLVTGVAANSKYHQLAFEGFEDYYYNQYLQDNTCPLERHFGADIAATAVTKEASHTGKYALEVPAGSRRVSSYQTSEPCRNRGGAPPLQPYVTGDCDCVPSFSPEPGRYVLTAWVKEGDGLGAYQYQDHRLRLITRGAAGVRTNDFTASGKIIEGWQRIEGVFEVSTQDQQVDVVFEAPGASTVYFDDLRIFPYDGDMKNFVYDDISLKLLSEIDANGYASFYEYDAAGQLIRIKKETERGLMTIQESASALPKK